MEAGQAILWQGRYNNQCVKENSLAKETETVDWRILLSSELQILLICMERLLRWRMLSSNRSGLETE